MKDDGHPDLLDMIRFLAVVSRSYSVFVPATPTDSGREIRYRAIVEF